MKQSTRREICLLICPLDNVTSFLVQKNYASTCALLPLHVTPPSTQSISASFTPMHHTVESQTKLTHSWVRFHTKHLSSYWRGLLSSIFADQCPSSAPYSVLNGHYCCVRPLSGEESIVEPTKEDDFVPCTNPPCKTNLDVFLGEPVIVSLSSLSVGTNNLRDP